MSRSEFVTTRNCLESSSVHHGGINDMGSTIGGYIGAYHARMPNPNLIKSLIIMTGFDITGYFFIHNWIK